MKPSNRKSHNFYRTEPFPKMRNFILDIMEEGKRKDIVYITFQADVTEFSELIQNKKNINGKSTSLTSYITYCFSKTVNEQKHMHALRKRKKLVIFDDVDLAIIIERKVEGILQPVSYIIRSANNKSFKEIQTELRKAKKAPLGENMALNKFEIFFFKLPKIIRKILWWTSRRNPKIRKKFIGTVGLTSLSMFGSGKIHAFPITPMTLTLAVGTITSEISLNKGIFQSRKMLNLTLCADHDIIDGAPMMRFINRLKSIIQDQNGNISLNKDTLES
ncbi:MAG: hypothetical protein DRN27_02525 [Thermoplasmata archaeon]|nr:MAG: hypothetical protein DRN27_02525 [Thermoplasmata archaeon]